MRTKIMRWLIMGILLFYNTMQEIYCGFSFRPDDPDLFVPCADMPEAKTIQDVADFSKANLSYQDDSIHISGEMKVVGDIEPTDRILFEARILKYIRNSWQATPVHVSIKDLCKAMYEADNFVNDAWGQYIIDEEKKCPAKGVIFHYDPFVAKLEYTGSFKWSGPHKLIITARFFEENDQLKDMFICSEIPGEMIVI